jgi:hypothetical protein
MNPEVKDQVAEQPKVEAVPQAQNVPQEQPKVEQETEKDINWKKFKEARQKEREHAEAMSKKAQEKEAEAAALKLAMEAMLNKPQRQQQEEYVEEETEDQRMDRKVNALLSKREAEQEKNRRQQEQQNLPNVLAQHMPDFNQVCSTENLDYLDYHYPEVAKAFNYMPDNVEKWSSVYKAVKRFVPNTDTKKDIAKMNQNMNKPQSLSSPGTTQPGIQSPVKLDEARREANWARMQKTLKSLS